jgi:hypothetical protein
LKPRKYASSSNAISSTGTSSAERFLPLNTHRSQLPPLDSDFDVEEESMWLVKMLSKFQ